MHCSGAPTPRHDQRSSCESRLSRVRRQRIYVLICVACLFWHLHLKIPRTSRRTAWKVPWANEKCATSYTVRCSNPELHWRRWWVDRAERVGEGVQSKISMCALENSYDNKTNSMEGAISEWKMRKIVHRRMLQSRAALKPMVRW
jgi:hypothetical protein